jgi:hypothetical protein
MCKVRHQSQRCGVATRREDGVPARARPVDREELRGLDCHAGDAVRDFRYRWSASFFCDAQSLDSSDWAALRSEISSAEYAEWPFVSPPPRAGLAVKLQ